MISNLRYAARNGEKVMIGGGEFDRYDMALAADMMEAYAPMLFALRAIVEEAGDQFGHEEGPGTINRMAYLARGALEKAKVSS